MTAKTAYSLFKKAYPKLPIRSMCDYNGKYYIVSAGMGCYSIHKKTDDIAPFNPTDNIAYFAKVSFEKNIDISSF